MEHPTNELEARIRHVEALAQKLLEAPSFYGEGMSYRIKLPGGFEILLETGACDLYDRSDRPDFGTDAPKTDTEEDSASGDEKQIRSSIIIQEALSGDNVIEGATRPLLTCFIELEPEQRVSGTHFGSRPGIPKTIPGGSDQDNLMLSAVLAFTDKLSSETGGGIFKFDSDDADEETLPTEAASMIDTLLHAANSCLAQGAHREQRDRSRTSPTDPVAWIALLKFEGPAEHVINPHNIPILEIKIDVDGIEYQYLKLVDGTVEIQVHPSNEFERYAGFKSFELDYDDDGNPESYAINDYREVEAQEAIERAMGLYTPTLERLAVIIEALEKAA